MYDATNRHQPPTIDRSGTTRFGDSSPAVGDRQTDPFGHPTQVRAVGSPTARLAAESASVLLDGARSAVAELVALSTRSPVATTARSSGVGGRPDGGTRPGRPTTSATGFEAARVAENSATATESSDGSPTRRPHRRDRAGTPSTSGPRIVAGIPAYEEAETIASVARAGRQHADRVVVVDDGSTDATAARAAAAGALVVRHSRNHGYGAALQTIFDQAARLDADHLVVLDGDGQHDATDIPKLIAAQRGADLDIVIGSRFQGVDQGDLPLYRRCGLAVINQLVSFGLLLLGAEFFVRDTQSGFRAYNRRAIRSLAGEASISDGMGASIDVLVHGCRRGFEIAEVGTRIRYDEGSTSTHHPVRHGAELLEHLLQMFLTSPRLPIVAWWRELERLVDATIDPRRGWYRTHPRRSGR